MTEEIYSNIFRIHVPLRGNPLKELNSYYVKGNNRELLIDAGFNREECYQVLMQSLNELNCNFSKLEMVATHLHSDHFGLPERIIPQGNKVYISEIDKQCVLYIFNINDDEILDNRYVHEGFPIEILESQKRKNSSRTEWVEHPESLNLVGMNNGDVIKVGDYNFEWIVTPGHTPGNSMLWEPEHKIMFTGDNILFSITPNITWWPELNDSLGMYIESLKAVKNYPVEHAFTGHREINGDYSKRIDEIISHHKNRLNEILLILSEEPWQNAYSIASKMTWSIRAKDWNAFPNVQKWFAVGECLSHIDYLLTRGIIVRKYDHNGIAIYSLQ